MGTFVYDSFTDTVGKTLSAHVGETGATWAKGTSFNNVADPVVSSTGDRIRSTAAVNAYQYTSGIAAADGEYNEAVVDVLSYVGSIGIGARCSATRAYFAHFGANIARILRLEANGTFTSLTLDQGGTSVSKVPTVGTHTIRIAVTGTGASVAIAVTYDGVALISATDTSASRITTLGSAGLLMNNASSDSTGMHITSVSGVDPAAADTVIACSMGAVTVAGQTASIVAPVTVAASVGAVSVVGLTASIQTGTLFSLTAPADGQIAQRSGTAGTIAVSGTYSGQAPTSIQARLVLDGTNTAVTGFDWATVVASPSGGAFAFSLVGVPQGGWYNVQLRDSAAPAGVTTYGKVGVGALVLTFGQSNAMKWFTIGDSTLTPDAKLRAYGNHATGWQVPAVATMNGAIATGNALVAALGVPVALLDYGFDGSGLTIMNSGGQWVPTSGATYQNMKNAVLAVASTVEAAVWIQGETDAKFQVGTSAYYAALGTLFSQLRADFGNASLPIVVAQLGRRLDGLVADADTDAIRKAIAQKWNDANIYRVERADLPVSADNIHHTPTGFTALGKRCAQAILFAQGLATQYRGPSFAAVTQVDSITYDVSLNHHSGTDFTPTTGITGFHVTDPDASNAVIAVSTAVRQSANTIRLTLASAPVSLPIVSYLYGSNPTITGVAKDNSTLALPLEYNAGVTATAGVTVAANVGTVTVAGLQATIQQPLIINATMANIAVAGQPASVVMSTTINAGLAQVLCAGLQAAVSQPASEDISCSVGQIIIVGKRVSIDAGLPPYISAPAGFGYTPKRREGATRPPEIQRNYR